VRPYSATDMSSESVEVSAPGVSLPGVSVPGVSLSQETPDEIDCADNASMDARVSRAMSGDRESLMAVWEDHRRWVAAILLAHKPRWADVDDLLQEVALSFVRKVHEIRDPRALRPWLRTVAMNAAHAAARSGKVRTWATGRQSSSNEVDSNVTPIDPASQPLDHVALDESGTKVLELAAMLPDGYREPLLLKAVESLSYREIGRILSLPESTIETRIARARKLLRELAIKNGLSAHA